MENLTVFNNSQFGTVRTATIDGDVWFVASDVCKALDITDTGRAVERLDEDESTRIEIDHPQSKGKKLEVIAVNESGLYGLVLGSRKQSAKDFKRWIKHDVLPSIRKTGGYIAVPETGLERYALAMEMQAKLARNQIETEKRVSILEESQKALDAKLDAAADALTTPPYNAETWQAETRAAVNRIVDAKRFCYQTYWKELYAKLESAAGVDLEKRKKNLKARMQKQGASAREIGNVSKLLVVANDKKLRTIFTGIVQRETAAYMVLKA